MVMLISSMFVSVSFVGYSANALAFYSGSRMIIDQINSGGGASQTVGNVYTVIFLLLDASFIVGQIAPYLQTFSSASGAGRAILETIDKPSPIDGTSHDKGIIPKSTKGNLVGFTFRNVSFAYPARPDVLAVDGVSLEIEAGKRTGICGISGSGKSTAVALCQRFYDPAGGQVLLDGTDLRDLNVRWLRSQIGVVGQEPVLFDCSIMKSIAHGLMGSPAHVHLYDALLSFSQGDGSELEKKPSKLKSDDDEERRVTELAAKYEEIRQLCIGAAKLADAHKFIEDLPDKYDTNVGEAGGRISGGQKQRIALARAIVKQPKLLILDEATAALDSHSEQAVQAAFEKVSEGRTTLAIAHRLSTLKDYDKIIVMAHGKIVEQGTHSELLALGGHYYNLAHAQSASSAEQQERDKEHIKAAVQGELDEEDDEEGEKTLSPSPAVTDVGSTAVESRPVDVKSKAGPVDTERGPDPDPPATARYSTETVFKRIAKMIAPQALFVVLGLATSTVIGGAYSGEAVIFGHVIEALNPCRGVDYIRSRADLFALLFFILALTEFCAYTINGSSFGYTSERLLFRVRKLSFRALVHQRMTWYEKKEQSPSTLISSLSADANNLGGLTGTVVGTIFSIFVNLIAGITLSHIVAWRIAIVILSTVPILLFAGYMRLKVLADFQKRHETAYVHSNALAIEAVGSIRTVAALGREDDVFELFRHSLQKPYEESLRNIIFGNVFLAVALSISYFIYGFAYWWGSKNVSEGRYSQVAFFTVLPALLFSAQASGQLLAFAPDFTKAHVSAANIFKLIDEGPDQEERAVQKRSHSGRTKADKSDAKANEEVIVGAGSESNTGALGPMTVEFKDVWFSYPTRPEYPALQGLTLKIQPGKFAAFIGQSGSGKSTTMGLIENFYEPSSGDVFVDGRRTSELRDEVLRRDMAIVPQEPVLFYGTVRFNVSLGAKPRSSLASLSGNGHADQDEFEEDHEWEKQVPLEDIVEACKAANIHETIMELPDGYDTLVGSKGSQLSGGQRQRLAIARALLRKPRVSEGDAYGSIFLLVGLMIGS